MRKIIYFIYIIIFANNLMAIDLSGTIRNDSFWMLSKDKSDFSDILENRVYMTYKQESWKCFADLRAFVYTADENSDKYKIVNPRLYVKYYLTPEADITIGKSYINLGNVQMLNPFELDKSMNFADLKYDKDGNNGAMLNLSMNDVSGMKLYLLPDKKFEKSLCGMDVYSNINTFDVGMVLSRKKEKKNVAGVYFKGDYGIGVNGSAAYHFPDNFGEKDRYLECDIGGDYSFFKGKLYLSTQLYFNEKGAGNKNEYETLGLYDGYFSAKYYSYSEVNYTIDDFTTISANSFVNLIDSSAIISPSVSYILFDGFNIILQYSAVTGNNNQEFTDEKYGRHIIDLRLEGKI